MLGTVRTSHTVSLSSERFSNPPDEGEWEGLDKLSFVFNEDPPVMCRERGHDVLAFQLPADEVCGSVELDAAVAVDLADERHAPLGDGKRQMAAGIKVGVEREVVRQMPEGRPEPVAEGSGEPGFVFGDREASAGLLEVMVAKEAGTGPPHGPQIGAAVNKDALLPEGVKALHRGVASGLARRDEQQVDAQQEMEPDRLGETVAISASSRGGHLVVHLGDPGKSHNTPGINEMAAEREGLLIGELTGRSGLPDDIDGVEGIEPRDAPGASHVSGPDQVGLLEIAHIVSADGGIRGSSGQAMGFDLLCSSGPGQDLFDGRDGGKVPIAPSLELEMDRLGTDAGKRGPAGLVGRQLVAQGQDLADDRLGRSVSDVLGDATLITKAVHAEGLIAASPLGEPEASPLDLAKSLFKADSVSKKPDRPGPSLIFVLALHRLSLLPIGMRRSLGDVKSVCDVLTVF